MNRSSNSEKKGRLDVAIVLFWDGAVMLADCQNRILGNLLRFHIFTSN